MRRSAGVLLLISSLLGPSVMAQQDAQQVDLERAVSDLRCVLDTPRRERGMRRLITLGSAGKTELKRALHSENEDVRRLAWRGLSAFDAEVPHREWLEELPQGARRMRRELALRLALDQSAAGLLALRILASDSFDDVRSAALIALHARGVAVGAAAVPERDADPVLRRAWIAAATVSTWQQDNARVALNDPELAHQLLRRIAREGGLPGLDLTQLIAPNLELQAHTTLSDVALPLLARSKSIASPPDLLALLFDRGPEVQSVGNLDRAFLLRCSHRGLGVVKVRERLASLRLDQHSWLWPAWCWFLSRSEREQVFLERCNGVLGEELAPWIATDPELGAWSEATLLAAYRAANHSAVREHILRAAARLPQRFVNVIALARQDSEPVLRQQAMDHSLKVGDIDIVVQELSHEPSPLVQVRVAEALAELVHRYSNMQAVIELMQRWATSDSTTERRVALHFALNSEPSHAVLQIARSLWQRVTPGDGDRSDVFALLASYEEARPELSEGLLEIGAEEERRARERVGSLSTDNLRRAFTEEQSFTLSVRGELAWQRARRGDRRSAEFLMAHFDTLDDDLALRALDALGSLARSEQWEFFERVRASGRFDEDLWLESATPMLQIPALAQVLNAALQNTRDPQMRQAAMRGLGRAGAAGQAWLIRIGAASSDDPGALSRGDFTAWMHALDRSAESALALSRMLFARAAAGFVLRDEDLRLEMARAIQVLSEWESVADTALLQAFEESRANGTLAGIETPALLALITACAEPFPRVTVALSRWAAATSEPDAALAYRTELELARDAVLSRDIDRLRAHLTLWLASFEELEVRGGLPARDQVALDLSGVAQPSLHAAALLKLLDARGAEAEQDWDRAREHYQAALLAAFFDVDARSVAHRYGLARVELAECARRDEARWHALRSDTPQSSQDREDAKQRALRQIGEALLTF